MSRERAFYLRKIADAALRPPDLFRPFVRVRGGVVCSISHRTLHVVSGAWRVSEDAPLDVTNVGELHAWAAERLNAWADEQDAAAPMTQQEALARLTRAHPQGGWCLDGELIKGSIGPHGARTELEVKRADIDPTQWTVTNKGRVFGASGTHADPVAALAAAIKTTLDLLEVMP